MSKQVESKVEIGIEYYNALIKQSRELAELREKELQLLNLYRKFMISTSAIERDGIMVKIVEIEERIAKE